MAFTQTEIDLLNGSVTVGGILSVCGCLFLVGSAIYFRKLRHSYWRAVVVLALWDGLTAATFVMSSLPALVQWDLFGPNACQLQGVMLELFVMLSNCYTFYVALVLYLIVVKRKELGGLFEIIYFAFVATAAAAMSLIPLYEVNGLKYTAGLGWCWVPAKPTYGRFVMNYVWVWTAILSIIIFYFLILRHIRREMVAEKINAPLSEIATGRLIEKRSLHTRQLFLYPLIYIVLWTPATINRMLEAQEIELYFMSLLEAGFLPLQGILNTCIYLFTSGIYRDILHVFWRRRLYRSLYAVSVDFAVPPQYDTDDDSDDAGYQSPQARSKGLLFHMTDS